MAGVDTPDGSAHIAGDGDYAIEVVSGSSHQERLEWLAQGRGEEPVDYACTALLLPEPDNPFDSEAVSVSIRGVRVGYLPVEAAASMSAAMQTWGFERATCAAIVEGGWYRSAEDKGDFCVRLDANPDFEPVALPDVDHPPPRPVPAVAAAHSRKTAYDLGLGAVATVALLALIGVVWLVVQPTAQSVRRDYPAGAATAQVSVESREAGLASRDSERERLERMALLDDIGRPRRTGRIAAALIEAHRDPVIVVAQAQEPPAVKPPLSQLDDLRPAVAIVEAVGEAAALVPPEPAKAVPSAAMTEADSGRRGPASDTAAVEGRPSLAAIGPRRAEEIGSMPDRGHVVASAASTAVAVPAAQSVSSAAQGAAPASAKPPADAAEPDARSQHKARARAKARSRAETRAARLKPKSRNGPRYSRKNRRAVEVTTLPQSPSPPPPGPQAVEPGLVPAARLLQGWTREWRTGIAAGMRRPVQQR